MWQVWQVMRFTLWPQIWMTVSQSHHPSGFTKAYLYSLSNLPWMDPNGYEKLAQMRSKVLGILVFFAPFLIHQSQYVILPLVFSTNISWSCAKSTEGGRFWRSFMASRAESAVATSPGSSCPNRIRREVPSEFLGIIWMVFFLDNLDGYSMVILWLFIIIIHLDGYFWGKNYG